MVLLSQTVHNFDQTLFYITIYGHNIEQFDLIRAFDRGYNQLYGKYAEKMAPFVISFFLRPRRGERNFEFCNVMKHFKKI